MAGYATTTCLLEVSPLGCIMKGCALIIVPFITCTLILRQKPFKDTTESCENSVLVNNNLIVYIAYIFKLTNVIQYLQLLRSGGHRLPLMF